MISRLSIRLAALALLAAPIASAADHFTPGEIWPDDQGIHINAHGGGLLFHEGTYYWFGEHKIAGPSGNSAQVGVSCYSSTTLYDWKNEGIALAVEENRRSEIAKGCIIERPKVIFNPRTKKFVMWFHLEHRGKGYATARTAVALADKVTGPYRFRESHRPNRNEWPIGFDPETTTDAQVSLLKRDRSKGQMSRDMTIFVDDDGRAYHIASAEENHTLHISLLTPDFLDFTGKFIRIFPGGHNEAPAICKHDGKYWLIASGCTGWDPNEARSYVADSMAGPWKSLGNPCIGTHPNGGMGPEKTWGGQSTFILPVHGKPGSFIAMFDVWRPKNPIDGRYLWLPVHFEDGRILITHPRTWQLGDLDKVMDIVSE
jgi:hypothetical protein